MKWTLFTPVVSLTGTCKAEVRSLKGPSHARTQDSLVLHPRAMDRRIEFPDLQLQPQDAGRWLETTMVQAMDGRSFQVPILSICSMSCTMRPSALTCRSPLHWALDPSHATITNLSSDRTKSIRMQSSECSEFIGPFQLPVFCVPGHRPPRSSTKFPEPSKKVWSRSLS